mmetsp:Transcript_8000/g.24714  ORF Transcript_8000/g.24714 Transcript_8000/m.24714 type:complete len:337 (-) Transcript_8000:1265-2275(-)
MAVVVAGVGRGGRGGHRPGDDEQLRVGDGGPERSCDRKRGGLADDAEHRGVQRRRRRATGRHASEETGRDEPGQDLVRDEALDRPQVLGARRPETDGHGAVQDRARGLVRRRLAPSRQREAVAVASGEHGADEDEGDGRGLLGQESLQGDRHSACVLQRLAETSHQGRRKDRRAGRVANHQRTHGGGAGVRHGQGGGRQADRGVRPGRRHVRRLDSGDLRRRLRSQEYERRHHVGRRGLRRSAAGPFVGGIQEGQRLRLVGRPAGHAALARSRGKSEARARQSRANRRLVAVHHGGPDRAQALEHQSQQGAIREHGRPSRATDVRPVHEVRPGRRR